MSGTSDTSDQLKIGYFLDVMIDEVLFHAQVDVEEEIIERAKTNCLDNIRQNLIESVEDMCL